MRYSFIFGALFAAVTTLALPLDQAAEIFSNELEGTLDKRAASSLDAGIKAKGKDYFGSCADTGLLNNAQNAAILKKDFGSLTPENSMKWDQINPNKGQYNWGNPDNLVNFAQTNGKYVRGHTFVWHSQLAGWVNSISNRNDLTKAIQDHVTTVMTRYKGKIREWDVANEVLNEDGSMRSSVFSRVLGEDFISIAFKAARAADPDARLYINDYNLDSSSAKRAGMVRQVKKWIAAGVPIDGIGTQSHLSAGQVNGYENHLKELLSAGVKYVAITELDIVNASANDYTTVVRSCLNVQQCVGITVWGVSDGNSWRANNNPLLFDRSFNPKPAYTAILNIL